MTNKEAIEILWQYDVNFEPHPAEEVMHAIDMAINALTAQSDNRLEKIADIVEGTIDHLNRDDAMDMLYQIKEVLK